MTKLTLRHDVGFRLLLIPVWYRYFFGHFYRHIDIPLIATVNPTYPGDHILRPSRSGQRRKPTGKMATQLLTGNTDKGELLQLCVSMQVLWVSSMIHMDESIFQEPSELDPNRHESRLPIPPYCFPGKKSARTETLVAIHYLVPYWVFLGNVPGLYYDMLGSPFQGLKFQITRAEETTVTAYKDPEQAYGKNFEAWRLKEMLTSCFRTAEIGCQICQSSKHGKHSSYHIFFRKLEKLNMFIPFEKTSSIFYHIHPATLGLPVSSTTFLTIYLQQIPLYS